MPPSANCSRLSPATEAWVRYCDLPVQGASHPSEYKVMFMRIPR